MEQRCKMSKGQRAKQFAPFSALKGYEEALRYEEEMMLKLMDSKTELNILSKNVDIIKNL